jgi:hypothetical protein
VQNKRRDRCQGSPRKIDCPAAAGQVSEGKKRADIVIFSVEYPALRRAVHNCRPTFGSFVSRGETRKIFVNKRPTFEHERSRGICMIISLGEIPGN